MTGTGNSGEEIRPAYPVSSIADFKKSAEQKGLGGHAIPLLVPSGNTALVRPVGIQAFFQLGLIPNTLLGLMQQVLEKASKGKKVSDAEAQKVFQSVAADPEKILDLIKMADAIVVYCVLEPKVHPTPEEGVERDEDLLYADEIDMEDKMFIMQFALGGTRDLEPFRHELATNMESLPTGQGVGRPTK